MAEELTGLRLALRRLQPADRMVLAYFALMCVVETVWFAQIPQAWWLITLHVAGAALVLYATRFTARPVWIFRYWCPLLYVACCYREMAMLIAAIRHARLDQTLADLDFAIWGVNPTVWLERFYSPALTEFLQIIYTLFVPVVLFVPWLMWRRGMYKEFRYMSFLLATGFLVSYLGYILVPAHGPRYLLEHLQNAPLKGLWLFDSMQSTLNRLESDHYDCFPSGHTEITLLAFWLSRSVSRGLFRAYFFYTICIVFATVYLRYHYTVDLLAGVLVALVLILTAPAMYRRLSVMGDSIGD